MIWRNYKSDMYKKRVEQVLRVLVMPFISLDYLNGEKDLISKYYQALFDLKETSWREKIKRKENEKQVHKSIKAIYHYLVQHEELVYTTFDDVMMLLNWFYPNDKICKEIKRGLSATSQEKPYALKEIFSCIYLKILQQISRSMLTYRNGIVSIKTWALEEDKDIFCAYELFNKVEIWNVLNRLMVTDILTVFNLLNYGITDRTYIRNEYGRVSLSDNFLDEVLKKGIAENHLHFSVAYNYAGVWINIMNIFSLTKEERKDICTGMNISYPHMFLYVSVLRFVIMDYISEASVCNNLREFAVQKNIEKLIDVIYSGDLYQENDAVTEQCMDYIKTQYFLYKENGCFQKDQKLGYDTDVLMLIYMPECVKQNTTSEIILLFEWMKYINQNNEKELVVCLCQYLRIKNYFFSKITQHNRIQGLEHFQYFFGNASAAKKINSEKNGNWIRKFLFKNQMQNPKLKKLEIRLNPEVRLSDPGVPKDNKLVKREMKRGLAKKLRAYFVSYRECCLEVKRQHQLSDEQLDQDFLENKISMPTLGIVFHFKKRKPIDDLVADWCWYMDEDDKLLSLDNILNIRKEFQIMGKAIAELRNEIPILGEYVVGIDAASSENNAEPWVFAPVYQIVRDRHCTRPLVLSDEKGYSFANLGLTYHVGEDFRHIISGLRHIDEVVEKFRFKHGDRVGHAIALGIQIEEWMEENEVVVMPRLEYMDNLLWIYGLIRDKRLDYPVNYAYIEKEVLEIARKLYGNNISGITMDVLYQVYRKKFLSDYQRKVFEKEKKNTDMDGKGSYFCKYLSYNTQVHWDEDKLLCTNFCPVYKERMEQAVWVKVDKSDLELFSQIQCMVRKNIESKGIIAEVNPTSNTAISSIKGIFNHYLSNLNSVDGEDRNVMTMINSDDPGMMATDIENELAYMYHKLLYEGVSVEKAIQWVDKIRNYGMEFSFIKTVKKPSVMLKELEMLIDKLEKWEYGN